MSVAARPSPARISVAAAAALPRWVLFALLAIYITTGLFGRDPWLADDATGFGIAWTMADGTLSDWLLPNVVGTTIAEEGPLAFWVAALFIKLLAPLFGEAPAARLSAVFWCSLAATALWYAAYRLARRQEAQPVAFVFGGEAHAVDFGRLLADIALLLLLGTVGIVLRLHEISAEIAALALVACALFGLVWSLDRPRRGAVLAGLALGALALARGPLPALVLLVAAAGLLAARNRATSAAWQAPLAGVLAAAAVFVPWPLAGLLLPAAAGTEYFEQWRTWLAHSIALPAHTDLGWILRNGAWYLWPLWPLAGWTLYAWRHGLRLAHIALPGGFLLAALFALLFLQPVNDSGLMLLVPPLVILAAFGATSLRRAADNLLDWFAMAVFTLFAVAAWAYFIALQTGAPLRMAASVMRLVPGHESRVGPIAIALAAVASAAWLALVTWRIARRPPNMWRGPALAAGGLTMLWVLLALLFMPAINYNRSYASLAGEIAAQVHAISAAGGCVQAYRLQPAHRALFSFHGQLRFARSDSPRCDLLLQRDSRRTQLDDDPPNGNWTLLWEGRWPARPDEIWRLYRAGGS